MKKQITALLLSVLLLGSLCAAGCNGDTDPQGSAVTSNIPLDQPQPEGTPSTTTASGTTTAATTGESGTTTLTDTSATGGTTVTLPPIATTTVGDSTKAPSATTAAVPEYPTDLGKGTTYYVSASQGDDGNDGKSPERPFKSVEAVNKLTLRAGDNVLFRRGDVFTGAHLLPKGAGYPEEGRWITLDAYGTGANPVFRDAATTQAAISFEHMTSGRGYRIRHIDIDGYLCAIQVQKTSQELAFNGLEIADCTVKNITQNKAHGERALCYGILLIWARNVMVKNVTIDNTDIPLRFMGGDALFDGLDVFNSHIQGVMLYGMEGDFDYDTVMTGIGNVTVQNSRIRYTGSHTATFGSTGILIENLKNCIVRNVEISHTLNTLGGFDACALDWEQSNIDCTIEDVYAHDNQGPMLLAMEHGSTRGNSRGNVVKNCVSVNNGLHGNVEVGSFINLSGTHNYDQDYQTIRVENCVDIGRQGSVPFSVDDTPKVCTSTPKIKTSGFTSGVLTVEASFDGETPLTAFATAEGVSVSGSRLVLKKGSVLRTSLTGSDYTVAVYLKGSTRLHFLSKDADNGYVWSFEKGKLLAQKMVGGKLTTIKIVAVSDFEPTAWFRVRVETEKGTIHTYIDDVLVSTLKDGTFTAGAAGLSATGSGWADGFLLWSARAGTRTASTYGVNHSLTFGVLVIGGDWHGAEQKWTATGITEWMARPFYAGWGRVTGKGATLTRKNVNMTVTGYNKVQLVLMNGTNSGTVYLEFSVDGGKTWHSKSLETAFRGEAEYWGFANPPFNKYTVDMSDIPQWTGRINGLRLRFAGTEGKVALKSVIVHK